MWDLLEGLPLFGGRPNQAWNYEDDDTLPDLRWPLPFDSPEISLSVARDGLLQSGPEFSLPLPIVPSPATDAPYRPAPLAAQTWQTRGEGKPAARDLSGTKQTKQSHDGRREQKENHHPREQHKENHRPREKQQKNNHGPREEKEKNPRPRDDRKGKGPALTHQLRRTSAKEQDWASFNLRRQLALAEICRIERRARADGPTGPRDAEEERQKDLAENGHLWSFDEADLLDFPPECKFCEHCNHVTVSSSKYHDILVHCQPRPQAIFSWNSDGEREKWFVKFSEKHMRIMVFNEYGFRVKTSALAGHFANPARDDNGVGIALAFLDRHQLMLW